jgi:hypothetical protein
LLSLLNPNIGFKNDVVENIKEILGSGNYAGK